MHRSEEGVELCATEHAWELHEMGVLWEMLVGGEGSEVSLGFNSQRMQLNGVHGNQTRSLPVSM